MFIIIHHEEENMKKTIAVLLLLAVVSVGYCQQSFAHLSGSPHPVPIYASIIW